MSQATVMSKQPEYTNRKQDNWLASDAVCRDWTHKSQWLGDEKSAFLTTWL